MDNSLAKSGSQRRGTAGIEFAQSISKDSVALVKYWLDRASTLNKKPDSSSQRLAGVLADPIGPKFTLGFVDRVARPDDVVVAAKNFRDLSGEIPEFLPRALKILIKTGGFFAPLFPGVVVPIARRALRMLVGHLVIDASERRLGRSLKKLRKNGDRLNINLLGEAVLGDKEADRRLAGVKSLITRNDVDYVSVKISSIASQLSMWSYEDAVVRVVERLAPLYEEAASRSPQTFINLDMEEFKDLDMTLDVFERLLSRKSLHSYAGGIVLQAYLPESIAAMKRIQNYAAARVKNGGAPIKVRVVKGANLQMEQVDADLHSWPLAVFPSKKESDANYKRVLEWSLTPSRVKNVRIGVAGHNLFDLAFAHLLAANRGVNSQVDFEMLIGMAPQQADAVRETVGGLVIYTPVVHPQEFDTAFGYLVRRLEENASPENFMSAVFDLSANEDIFRREERRFRESLSELSAKATSAQRTQDRKSETVGNSPREEKFRNEPDSDLSILQNRAWIEDLRVFSKSKRGRALGVETLARFTIADSAGPIKGRISLDDLVSRGRSAGAKWANRPISERASILLDAADHLAARRGELLSVMMQETGKTLQEGDVEVSEAVDFARFYAYQSQELEKVDGAQFDPAHLILAVPPWNFPVAIPAGSVLSALAAGSAVVIKPAPQARRCAAVMVEALWAGGVPKSVLQLVNVAEGQISRSLVTHPGFDKIILTGSFETARKFRSWRADLSVIAETSGKNALVVTPSADFDLAVSDIVKSAYGHAGQKCSAASMLVLVGSVGRSQRFRRQLLDAIETLRVGFPDDPKAVMGPVIEPPGPKLRAGLTELGPGERWVIEPQPLDSDERLWTPGLREGVKLGSDFQTTEYFGPVLGIATVRTLDEALAFQNSSDFGLTAGIHSLDADEVSYWLDRVQAGNCYVNRGITGAVVQRQPFGGWKKSSVGPGWKAGGPNYLFGLGSWRTSKAKARVKNVRQDSAVGTFYDSIALQSKEHAEAFLRSMASDSEAWEKIYGVSHDYANLTSERNLLRYRPTPVQVRVSRFVPMSDALRVVLAGLRVGGRVSLSVTDPLPDQIVAKLLDGSSTFGALSEYEVESEREFVSRVSDELPSRIRLLGSRADALEVAFDGAPEVAIFSSEVTESGRVELLPFLIEQSISLTVHRFGAVDKVFQNLEL